MQRAFFNFFLTFYPNKSILNWHNWFIQTIFSRMYALWLSLRYFLSNKAQQKRIQKMFICIYSWFWICFILSESTLQHSLCVSLYQQRSLVLRNEIHISEISHKTLVQYCIGEKKYVKGIVHPKWKHATFYLFIFIIVQNTVALKHSSYSQGDNWRTLTLTYKQQLTHLIFTPYTLSWVAVPSVSSRCQCLIIIILFWSQY